MKERIKGDRMHQITNVRLLDVWKPKWTLYINNNLIIVHNTIMQANYEMALFSTQKHTAKQVKKQVKNEVTQT